MQYIFAQILNEILDYVTVYKGQVLYIQLSFFSIFHMKPSMENERGQDSDPVLIIVIISRLGRLTIDSLENDIYTYISLYLSYQELIGDNPHWFYV